ncbi:Pre-mRNA-splicing factor [Ceratobasidium theobromae]|uniref:Pre-mRNA-splicing factor n=1 Tax=Ceratobasidium theobromae TaxID=1582974 RepID=A0A5N5QWZ0_9AGAM|nr:Pre-mRNA-splicing factor [Ceratobasidium theobromae]
MANASLALPSERELELETLLRQRDKQISALTDELSSLQRKLPGTSDPPDDAAICIPSPILALLAPLVAHGPSTSTPAPLNSAILQRLKLLQTENDELYEHLRTSESTRAREEVVGLRKTVKRLESSLEDAEAKIAALTSKLDHGRLSLAKSVAQQQHQQRRSSTPDQRRSASPPRRSVPVANRPRERSREFDRERDRERERDRDRDREKDRERERERERDRDRDRDWDRDRDRDRGGVPTGPRAHKKPRLGPVENAGRKPGEGPGGAGGRNGNDGQRNVSGRNGIGGGRGGPPRGPGVPIRGSAAGSTQNGNAAQGQGQGGDRGLVQRLGL